MTTQRTSLRPTKQNQDEIQHERDQHPQDESRATRTVHMTKRRKHLFKRAPDRALKRVVAEDLVDDEALLQVGEVLLLKGAPVHLLAQVLGIRIAEMDVTLDVLVEPVEVDPEHPKLKVYVDKGEAQMYPAGATQTQRAAAQAVRMVRR